MAEYGFAEYGLDEYGSEHEKEVEADSKIDRVNLRGKGRKVSSRSVDHGIDYGRH